MTGNRQTSRFFTVGGPVPLDAAYVVRPTDEQLFHSVLSGEYCNVLTAYQMGKSSLIIRTANRLREERVCAAIIDLADIGIGLDANEWYSRLITSLKSQLDLTTDERTWEKAHTHQDQAQRFINFLRNVVLDEIAAPVVIFVDEIDATLSLPFTDDFFAAIRAAYNARTSDPTYKRLTFVLLGTVQLTDLIKDRSRAPYDIGLSIDLEDFTQQEASTLLPGLETKHIPPMQANMLLERVLYRTAGHPYLTQKICAEIAATGDDQWTDDRIDQLVKQLFLSDQAREESNLEFVSNCILKSRSRQKLLHRRAGWIRQTILDLQETRDREKYLRIYSQVLSAKPVVYEEHDPVKSQLKLIGLLKITPQGTLAVRNRIYEAVFNPQWSRGAWRKVTRMRMVIVAMATAIMGVLCLLLYPALPPHHFDDLDSSFEKCTPWVQWVYDGKVIIVTPAIHGTQAAQLGTPVSPIPRPQQENIRLYREIVVPADVGRPMLTFWYRMYVNDIIHYSDFHICLADSNGDCIEEIKRDGFRSCTYDSQGWPFPPPPGYEMDWRTVSYDLSNYKGETVRLMFENRNLHAGYSWGIWTRVDAVQIETPMPPPTPPGPERAYLPVVMIGTVGCDPIGPAGAAGDVIPLTPRPPSQPRPPTPTLP